MTQTASGAGPPPNIEPADLWTKLTTLPRPHTEVAFPRKDPRTSQPMTDKVAIWVLTESELMSARAAADAYAHEILLKPQKSGDANIGYQDIYRNACVIEIVWRCCRAPVNVQVPAFPSTKAIRQWFTSDEIAVLFQAYCAWQRESGPILSTMEKSEMDAWIAVLKEGGSRVPLARLASESVIDLLMHSVSLLPKSAEDSGSPGLLPSEFSPNSSPQAHQSSLNAEESASKRRDESSSLASEGERPQEPELD
jgi:hypothetical protein